MTEILDPTALQVSAAYKRGVAAHVEAGRLLASVKKAVGHKQWLLWLKAHMPILGFGERTAQRLIKLARNPASTSDLWGNGTNTASGHLFTTAQYANLVKAAFGGDIDLDPSSCVEANEKYVGALKIYTAEQDGLAHPWRGRIYLNPMYDNIAPFIVRLHEQIFLGNCVEAITLTPAATDREWFQTSLKIASAICFPQKRVHFHAPGTGKLGTPALPSAFTYFGPNHHLFETVFQQVGAVWKPSFLATGAPVDGNM